MSKELMRYRFTYEGKRYAVYGHSPNELIDKAAAKKRELEEGRRLERNVSVNAWKQEWLETYKSNKVSKKTLDDYRSVLSHLNLTMPMKDVRPVHLQKILNGLAGRSESLISKFCILTKELFEDAVDNGICMTNPARKLSKPKGYKRARRPLTLDERRLIEKVAQTSVAGRYVALMLYAGLRPGETGIVQGKDVDLSKMMLHVRGTKTKNADRYVPISDKLLPFVKDLKRNEYAVVNAYGDPSTKESRKGLWHRFKRELNIEAGAKVGRRSKHSPHDLPLEDLIAEDLEPYLLRHTFCTDLEAAGVPINVARDLMGHSSITITSQIYTHRSDEAMQDAASKMNRYTPGLRVIQGDKKSEAMG